MTEKLNITALDNIDIDIFATLRPRFNYLGKMPRFLSSRMIELFFPKEAIRIILALLSEVNTNGEITELYSLAVLYEILKDKLGEDVICRSTFYDWIKKFRENDIITYDGSKLVLVGYKDTFKKGKSDGTFYIPSFMYSKEFKSKSVTAHRLCLIWLSRIGEKSSEKAKTGYGLRKGHNDEEFENLKRRCPAEVEAAMKELDEYFDIEEYATGSGNTYQIHLKEKYIVSKDMVLKDDLKVQLLKGVVQPVYYKFKKTWYKVLKWIRENGVYELLERRELENKDNPDFEDLDIYSAISVITKLLHKYKHVAASILSRLKVKLQSKDHIKSLGGFIQTLIDVYILNKPSEVMELKQLEKLIKRLEEYGMSAEDYPWIEEKRLILTAAAGAGA